MQLKTVFMLVANQLARMDMYGSQILLDGVFVTEATVRDMPLTAGRGIA
jgi:hypothetical protein